MEPDWVMVYETEKQFEIEIIKGMLMEHDIEAVVLNKKDSAYLFGYFELYVSRDNVMKSKTLILDFNS